MPPMGKRGAVPRKSGQSVDHSDPGLKGPTTPPTAGRNPEACPSLQPKSGRGLGRSPNGAEGTVLSCLDEIQTNRNEPKALQSLSRNSLGRNLYCGVFTAKGVDPSGGEIYRRVNCKCWDCPYCGPRRAWVYRNAIAAIAEQLSLCRFFTLTLDPKKIQGDPIRYLRRCFNHLRVYLHRRYGKSPTYISVLELHKSGIPHFHIIIDRYIEYEWLKQAWEAVGGGFEVDIRFVDVQSIAKYLTKYLTKDLLLSMPKGTRRITCSRSIKLLSKPQTAYEWTCLKVPIFEFYRRFCLVATKQEFDPEEHGGFLRGFEVNPKPKVKP